MAPWAAAALAGPALARWRVLVTAGIALPAVAGWLSRSYDVATIGVIVGLIGAVLAFATRFAGVRTRAAHAHPAA